MKKQINYNDKLEEWVSERIKEEQMEKKPRNSKRFKKPKSIDDFDDAVAEVLELLEEPKKTSTFNYIGGSNYDGSTSDMDE